MIVLHLLMTLVLLGAGAFLAIQVEIFLKYSATFPFPRIRGLSPKFSICSSVFDLMEGGDN